MKVGKLSNKFNVLVQVGRLGMPQISASLSGCASFLGLPGPCLDTGFGLSPNSGKLGSTKPGTVSFVWPKPKHNRLDWLCRADISHITHKHSKDMCPSVPQHPERSAVRYRPIAAQNCIFIAIIDYLKLWSEEETILFNKA